MKRLMLRSAMLRNRPMALAGFVVLALSLSGCGPQSVASGVLSSDSADFWIGFADGTAFWQAPDKLVVIMGGSSSCESVITKIEETEKRAVLTLERQGGPLCTADQVFIPTYFTLEGGRPEEVVVMDGSTEFRLQVVDIDPDVDIDW